MAQWKDTNEGKAGGGGGSTVAPGSGERSEHTPGNEAAKSSEEMLLRNMAAKQKGIISKVTARGELGRRIRDMGLVPGTLIEIQGRAPLKDPVAIRVRGFTLTLRNNEADQILIKREETR